MKLDNRIWGVITAIVVIALLAGGWFLGVSPQLDSAAAAARNEQGVDSQITLAQTELTALKKARDDQSDLDDQLAALQKQVPTTTGDNEFINAVDALAARSKVSIQTLTIGDPTAYMPPAGAAAPAASSGASSTATPAPEATATAPAAASTAPTPLTDGQITSGTLATMPVSITVTGSLENLIAFEKRLQSMDRLFLVTNVLLTAGAAEAGESTSLVSTGSLYVLTGSVPIPETAK